MYFGAKTAIGEKVHQYTKSHSLSLVTHSLSNCIIAFLGHAMQTVKIILYEQWSDKHKPNHSKMFGTLSQIMWLLSLYV